MIRFHALIMFLITLILFIPAAVLSLIMSPRKWFSDLNFMSLMMWHSLANLLTGKDHIYAWLTSDPELNALLKRAEQSIDKKDD